jgi:molybdopterin synthase sulfur carrier subunit
VTILPPLDAEFFGGAGSMEVDAGNLFELIGALGRRSPGFAEVADVRAAIAVDDVLTADWSTSLTSASDVLLVPRVGGG